MVTSPSKYQPVPVVTSDSTDVNPSGRSERRQRGGRQNTGRRHNRELLLRMRDAQLSCPNPLGWGARHISSGLTKAPVEEEKSPMLQSPVAVTPPPRASDNFSPETGEKDMKENDTQAGAAFEAIREALGLSSMADGKLQGPRLALTSLENFNAGPVHTDPAVVSSQLNSFEGSHSLAQKPNVPQVSADETLLHPPNYRAPEAFPVVVPPPVLPIIPAAPKPTLTALDPELAEGVPQNTTTNLGHIELSMPPTLPSPVGSQFDCLSSLASVSQTSTPMAWSKDDVAVEESWTTLQATLGMGAPPGTTPASARAPVSRFEASLLAATSTSPPPPPLQQTPWWATPQQNPPLNLGMELLQYSMPTQTLSFPPAPSLCSPTGLGLEYPGQPASWPMGGLGDSMEGHKAALAAAVQASCLGCPSAGQSVPVETEQQAPTGTSSHKAAYRRPTDDEITAKLQALQKQPQAASELVRQVTDQEIVDRLLKVKAAAQPAPVPEETTPGAGPTDGAPAESEAQRIRI